MTIILAILLAKNILKGEIAGRVIVVGSILICVVATWLGKAGENEVQQLLASFLYLHYANMSFMCFK